ncbi:MAG: sigma-70 family RNA polymerase sigma factor [Candidatus Hydrogenedentes bacterium]|nr:sigma-70 family RNA polymerase sigma factor [Candidatus Hydrogenedentota bacterium]
MGNTGQTIAAGPDDTSRLTERACKGDSEAFAQLADHHYRTVYGIAFSAVGNWSGAQDIAQETFLLAWSRRTSLRNFAAFPFWLRRIASNLSKDWIRSSGYRRRLADHYKALSPSEIDSRPAPDAETDRDMRKADVWRALETLSPNVREAVVLYYLYGESLHSVAASLGISENAAKKRLQHGRAKLRHHFEAQWKEEMARAGQSVGAGSVRDRFLAGVLVGPAVPELAKSAVPGGLTLKWLNLNTTGLVPAFIGVMAMSAHKGLTVAAIVAIAVGGLWVLNKPKGDLASSKPNVNEIITVSSDSVPASETPHQVAEEDAREPRTEVPAQQEVEQKLPAVDPAEEEPENFLSLRGRVLDGKDTPVAGASLVLMRTGRRAPTEAADADALRTKLAEYQKDVVKRGVIWSGATNDAGSFQIDKLPIGGTARLVARAPGFKADSVTIYFNGQPEAKDEVTIRLTPGITVQGILLNADGNPVPDGQIEVCGISTDGGSSGTSDDIWTWTDSQGRFELDIEDSGWLALRVISRTEGAITFERVRADIDEKLMLRFPPASTVFGTVRDVQGAAMPNVEVRFAGSIVSQSLDANGNPNSTSSTSGDTFSALTGASGAYRIEGFDPGQRYTSEVLDAYDELLTSGPGIMNLVPGTQHELNFVVSEPTIVQGTIIGNATNKPVAGVGIIAIHDSHIQPSYSTAPRKHQCTTSGPDGRYSLKIVGEAGRFGLMTSYSESAYGWGGDTTQFVMVSVRPGETVTQDLHADEFATRTFLVVDDKGAPVEKAYLSITAKTETFGMGYGLDLHTGADGRVAVTRVPSNVSTEITFVTQGYFDGKSRKITAEPAANIPEEVVVMYRVARARLTAIDSNGNPFAGRTVEVELDYGDDGCSSSFITDEYGAGITEEDAFPAMNASLRLWLKPADDGSPRLDAGPVDVTLVEGENDLGQIIFGP